MNGTDLEALLARQQPGRSLEREFYLDAGIWRLDVERVLSNKWHLVGHVAQVPESGDYFTVDLLDESIIVVRAGDDIKAFYNVCRHRGAQLCTAASGQKDRFTCPYHGWTYALDGTLAAAPMMAESFEPGQHGLHTCTVRVFEGVILICLSEAPPNFDALFASYAPLLQFYGLRDAKIAAQRRYTVNANWKLVVENGLECYHCFGVHPVFALARSRAQVKAIGTDERTCPADIAEQFGEEFETWRATVMALPEYVGSMVTDDESSDHLRWLYRGPLAEGYVTESIDGKPVAPFIGDFDHYDNATSTALFNPWSWIFASSDHAVTFRWTPTGADSTEVELTWLVDPHARENEDYDPDRVAKVHWDTSLEDKHIIESVRIGIRSRHYRPGQLSRQEATVERFVRWYLRQLQASS